MPSYEPLISDVRQSKYGYWIVDISVAPAMTISLMIAILGLSPEEARSLALNMILPATLKRGET